MQHVTVIVRRLVMPALVAGGVALAPAVLQSQARTATERILVLPPQPASDADSAFAVTLARDLRDRMDAKYRFDFRIIPTSTICEALEASGFGCGVVPPGNAAALARFLQASGYIIGWLERGQDSLAVHLRMVDQGRSGLSGWLTVRVPASMNAGDVARRISDELQNHVDAADRARQCVERRERSDFRGARQRADQAFEKVPDHPSAAMCLALSAEATQQPADSIIKYLRIATEGDSLNARAWATLGRRLQERGDTLGALNAFIHQLEAEPNDLQLRLGVAAGLITQGDYQRAVDLLDEALAQNPADLQVLRVKERACLDGSLWDCALEALQGQYEVDSTLVGDSIFYAKAFGAAQSASDTAAMLHWSAAGVQSLPQSLDMWRARANALRTAGRREEALQAYRRVVSIDSTQLGAALAAAQMLLDTATLMIDSTVPLDTARLFTADTLLQLVGSQARDSATMMNVAFLYFQPATRLVQQRMRLPLAERFLEQALRYDVQGRLGVQANFFLGLAIFFQLHELDARVRETQSCELVDVEVAKVQRAKEAMTAGQQVSPPTARQVLQVIGNFEQALPTYKPVFKCPGS